MKKPKKKYTQNLGVVESFHGTQFPGKGVRPEEVGEQTNYFRERRHKFEKKGLFIGVSPFHR